MIGLVFFSCSDTNKSNQNDATNIKDPQTITPVTSTPDTIVTGNVPDVVPTDATSPVENEMSAEEKIYQKRALALKSYSQFLSSYFTQGSDEMTVIRLQGRPTVEEEITIYEKTFFYDDCEVRIKNSKVSGVTNGQECLRYIPLQAMLSSSNPKANQIADRIMETNLKKKKGYYY